MRKYKEIDEIERILLCCKVPKLQSCPLPQLKNWSNGESKRIKNSNSAFLTKRKTHINQYEIYESKSILKAHYFHLSSLHYHDFINGIVLKINVRVYKIPTQTGRFKNELKISIQIWFSYSEKFKHKLGSFLKFWLFI